MGLGFLGFLTHESYIWALHAGCAFCPLLPPPPRVHPRNPASSRSLKSSTCHPIVSILAGLSKFLKKRVEGILHASILTVSLSTPLLFEVGIYSVGAWLQCNHGLATTAKGLLDR